MTIQPSSLPPVIPRKLRAFDRARKRASSLTALAESFVIYGAGVLLVVVIEGLAHPRLPWRVFLSSAIQVLAGAWLIIRLGNLWLRRPPTARLARDFEAAANFTAGESIWSAVEMSAKPDQSSGVSRWMVEQTVARAAREIEAVDPRRLVDGRPLARAAKRAAGAAGILILCLVVGFGGRLHLAVDAYASPLPLSRVKFLVMPGNCSVPEGTNLVIVVSASRLPEKTRIDLSWADGVHESIAMTQSGTNLFQSEIPSVSQSFRYQILADQAESPVFTTRVLSPPRLSQVVVKIQPPAYTHWTNQVVEGGNADFITGSKVTVELRTSGEEVARAELYAPGVSTQQFLLSNSSLQLELEPTNRLGYGIRLVGKNQLVSETAPDNTLNPLPDLPPSTLLAAEGLGQGLVERDEVLPLTAQASDDVGLRRVDMIISSPRFPREVRNLYDALTNAPRKASGPLRDFSAPVTFNLPEFKPAIGDEMQLFLVATDLSGQTNTGNLIGITVGTAEKAVEARMAARLKELLGSLLSGAEYLAQTRASWTSAARNFREMDPAAAGATVAMVRSRISEFKREIEIVGTALEGESKTNEVNDARFIYRLGTSISTWARDQETVLRREADQLDPSAPEYAPAIFNRGRDLLELAAADLTNFTRVTTILQGTFETDVLSTRCETAQGRYKRGLPVLRGDPRAALESALNPWGLDVTFFEGIDLKGRVIEKKIDVPRFDNYAPATRREQWSCRYEGDLQIWEPGVWTLACIADDGVRVFIDGESVLPDKAWSAHPATEYRADLEFHTGWHPMTIEFFQGSSLSKLQILLGKQANPLHEIPAFRLRPRSIRAVTATETNGPATELSVDARDLLRARVATSLQTTAIVPPTLSAITNAVDISDLSYMVANRVVTGVALSDSIARLPTWSTNESATAERAGDALTLLSHEAQEILRTELDKYRWRYEGAAALKSVQNAIEELRVINDQLRRLPSNQNPTLDEKERGQVAIAQAWEKELARATQNAAHVFFEQARRKDATLAEKTYALQAATKTANDLAPAVAKLEPVLEHDQNKSKAAEQIDRRLNEISDRYRELNDLQERMNRERVAGLARKALPAARAFEQAQKEGHDPALDKKFDRAQNETAAVAEAARVAGDYREAARLDKLAGDSPANADAPALASEIHNLASQTDHNPPSLASTIPPPMQKETDALAAHQEKGAQAAEKLAPTRLAISLEAQRLAQRGDPKAAAAYDLLGQDLAKAMNAPEKLDDQTLRPLTERALALAGKKGAEARAAEIAAAKARMDKTPPKAPNAPALAAELDALSALSLQAARDHSKDPPLLERLNELVRLAPPVSDWANSTDEEEVAASASHDSKQELVAHPKSWEAHTDSSEILAEAARLVREIDANRDLEHHDPFPSDQETPPGKESAPQPSDKPSNKPSDKSDQTGKMTGDAGKAITQTTPGGLDQAEWARLNERLQKNIRNSGGENFTEEQRAAIQAYFEKLAATK